MTSKRTEFPSLTLVGLLIATFFLSGCVTVRYSVSQVQPIPDIGKVMRGPNRYPPYPLRLKLPDVELDVKAHNLVSPAWPYDRRYEGTKLLVLLALSPKADGVRFDPSRVRYQPKGGQPGHVQSQRHLPWCD